MTVPQNKGTTYVNIRIIERKNRNVNIDILAYFQDGRRMKVKPSSFAEGKVNKGYYSDTETIEINDRINDVWQLIKNSVSPFSKIEKKKIEENRDI